jgi:LysM repeat protein
MIDKKREPVSSEDLNDESEAGLPTGTLWTIIGINALISTIISLLVVLIVGPWIFTGTVSGFPLSRIGSQEQPPLVEGTPLDQLTPETENSQGPPTPTPSPEPIVYVVEVGDSLSAISEKFGVSVKDIMVANGLEDEDYLQAGQTLLIPIGGLVEATPTFTPIPIPTETPIPFEPPSEAETITATPATDISLTSTPTPSPIPTATAPPLDEIAVEITNVLGYGQVEEEMVIIFNRGPGVNLSAWTLTGSSVDDYSFPNLFLWNGGSVRIHTTSGANTPTDLYWDQEEPHWFSGDTVVLRDAKDEVMSSYTIP